MIRFLNLKKIAMKQIKLLSLIAMTLLISLTACEEEEEKPDCEVNNYGTVIMKNETGFDDLQVKVNGEERSISNGSEATYDEVDAGSFSVWMSLERNSHSSEETKNLESCQEYTLTVQEPQCGEDDYGWINVSNETGQDGLYVDVTTTSSSMNDERILDAGQTTTYEMSSGTVRVWASLTGASDEWTYSDESLNTCEEMNFNWTAGKKSNQTIALKVNDSKAETFNNLSK